VSGPLWITGVGLATALGVGVEKSWGALVRGERAIVPITLFDAREQRVGLGAEIRDLPPALLAVGAGAESRTGTMAIAAAREAIAMAGLQPATMRVGLVVGSTTGGLFETELLLARLHSEPESAGTLADLARYPLSGTAAAIGLAAGPFARVRTVSSACSSGANAIVVAASWLVAGELDAVVAGGSDSLCRLTLSGFNALTALAPEPCRPFDLRRRGTSLGEGAGFVVIERSTDARARGTRPLVELAGWASGADAYHVTNPEPTGRAMGALIAAAMTRASLEPRDLDYVNAHGTGTRANDSAEAAALVGVLGAEVRRVAVSSSKGQIGHTLAAAGAIEAVITTLVVARDVLVPTGGLEEPDPSLGLVHVPRVGRKVERVRAALSNSFGFGGMNAVLAFRKVAAETPSHTAGAPIARRVVVVAGAHADARGVRGLSDGASFERPATGAQADADELDPERSRRFDVTARRAAVAALRALADAGIEGSSCGALFGTAFGTVDGTGAFMHRVLTKGTRYASPADFPNLLPSTSAGHVSIYAGLTGPLFALVDPTSSGPIAILEAIRLVAAGVATRMLAGSSEPRTGPVVAALARVVDPDGAVDPAGEAASLLLVEEASAVAERRRTALATVEQVLEWQGPAAEGLARLRSPTLPAATVFASRLDRDGADALASSPWGGCPRWSAGDVAAGGFSQEALGFLVAAARLGCGSISEALVLGSHGGRGYAVRLARPGQGAP
jgi:3-oxoacyl-[acyl-carrier-protein] synthase II